MGGGGTPINMEICAEAGTVKAMVTKSPQTQFIFTRVSCRAWYPKASLEGSFLRRRLGDHTMQ
jgi:hypothetical protein